MSSSFRPSFPRAQTNPTFGLSLDDLVVHVSPQNVPTGRTMTERDFADTKASLLAQLDCDSPPADFPTQYETFVATLANHKDARESCGWLHSLQCDMLARLGQEDRSLFASGVLSLIEEALNIYKFEKPAPRQMLRDKKTLRRRRRKSPPLRRPIRPHRISTAPTMSNTRCWHPAGKKSKPSAAW